MKRSSMSDSEESSRYGRCDGDDNSYDSDRPHKKPKTEDDAVSSTPFREKDLWVLTSFLGKGSYGSVHLAVRTTEGEEEHLPEKMAIKTTEFSQASRLKNEAEFLNRLQDSPYIVSYYGDATTHDKKTKKKLYNTILEYCQGQCLEKLIKLQRGIGLAEENVKVIAMSILIGLKHIHDENIIHCDIKPKNILLAGEHQGGFVAKISGFGKAMEKGSIEYGDGWGHVRGTTRFMSPELIGDKVLDFGADVWAFGCTVLEMLTGERVWAEHGELCCWEEWITLIGESDWVPYVPDSLSEEAKDFLSKCFRKDPARRSTVDSLMNHPFVRWNKVYPEEEEEEEEEEIFEEEEEVENEMFEEEEEEEEEEIFEEEEIEIDEEYPKEDSDEEEDLK
ncbi:Protein kinase superfamily protein [Hirschfeldia incana]|nr:Protein kinase superfamily protein [Hirschfeldia incana]